MRCAAQLNYTHARRNRHGVAHRLDALSADDDHGRRDWCATTPVDEPRGANDDRRRRRRLTAEDGDRRDDDEKWFHGGDDSTTPSAVYHEGPKNTMNTMKIWYETGPLRDLRALRDFVISRR